MTEESVYLSLGSNLGRREHNLRSAVQGLSGILEQMRCSSIYETRPMYVEQQPKFLNMVAAGFFNGQPSALLERLLVLELRLGRNRENFMLNGPRIIDIDILLFGDRIVKQKDLLIPHPRLKERQFVLIPLLELKPDLRDPESGNPLAKSLERLEDQGVYIFKA